MTFRIVSTALEAAPTTPEPRPGGWSDALLEACLARPGLEPAIERLRDPNVLVVTSGQQPGLFTGPLYTIYKALSAGALATRLEARWETPVVPVFWVAGDDHDFAEANHTTWLRADGSLCSETLRTRPPEAPLTPMYREPLGPEVLQLLESLAADLASHPFGQTTIDWLAQHYHPENTFSGAFGSALAELLAPFGVVCFDSTHPAVKRMAAGTIVTAAGLARDLDRDLAARAGALESAGIHPGVTVGEAASLIMLEGRLGRDRLMLDGQSLVTRRSHERFDLDQLQAIAAEEPQRFSPNVLLRPVVESALLPTVAYVAGPGELRYLELTQPIYQRLRLVQQTAIPRWSGMVVPRRVDRVLEKFGAELDQLLEPDQALEARVVQGHMPPEAVQALVALRESIEAGYDAIQRVGIHIDPTVEKPIARIRNQALKGVADAEHRLTSHLKRREKTELAQIERARSAVFPHGKPQERVLGIASLLAQYGPELLDQLAGVIGEWYASALEGDPIPS
ncbi:MAG: bacillithiol biosynthesis cysteine-adding enzyme BshC [Gemmatimonadales bacterium]|nr:bacillithiol biosynthesis cysteine-adding enzyme BshC [Gemmatimonadales bacterium]